ncbi:MAG: putative DNA binding domain-containing protein [Candidatus Latescibacteria bacterium]|nr:putative DNA binding domain-containing protein [Candidatus Latescibacterota bacterium]
MQQPDPRVDRLLSMRAWQVFECKRANLHPSQALVPIVALANAEGGVFVLGLEDPDKADGAARLIGVSEHLDNEEELLNLVPKTITPPIPALRYEEVPIVNHRGQADHLLMFIVPKSPDVHSTLYGDAYLRRGRTNRRLTAAEILQLKYAKGAWHVEDEPVPNATLDDLDRDLLGEYMEAVAARESDVMTFFRSNGLTAISEDKPVLTKAAVLLFGINPAITLRAKCGIKLSTFRGTEAHPSLAGKPISIEGPLSRQIWECVEYLKRWRDGSPALRYPDYALQEAITNAVIHRDYAVQNDIQVRLFDDRVEVESPGRLAGHVTLAAIRHERFARNPIILRTLNRFPQAPNLDIGDGVKRLFDAMRQAGLADPVYEAPADRSAVRLILYNHLRDSLWDQVAQWLDHYGTVTNHDVRQLTGIEDRVRVSRLLHSWVERGLLVSRGTGKRDRHYMRPADAQPSLFDIGSR